jgi:hypothetical protein
VTVDEIRALDAWIRQVTGAHAALADPWRLVVPHGNGGADLVVQVDPVEAERRGHGPRADEVLRLSPSISFGRAREAVIARLARESGPS